MAAARRLLPLLALAALVVAVGGCGGAGAGAGTGTVAAPAAGTRPVVTLGTRASPEQLVIGQLYQQALEARGFRVRLRQNLGSPEIADAALRSGQIDLFPESVGTFDRAVARDETAYPDANAAFAAAQAYASRQGFALLSPTPFSDAGALAVTRAFARAHRLRDVGDLAAIRGLRLGAAPDFLRRDAGLPGLARVYGLVDVDFAPLTIGLQYHALDDGMVDAAAVTRTDGELADGRYVLLADPSHLFGFHNLTLVVASRVLAAEGPAFADALDAVSGALTTRAMQQLNAAVTLDRKLPAGVARDFLRAHRLA